jgi:hypothetical protein
MQRALPSGKLSVLSPQTIPVHPHSEGAVQPRREAPLSRSAYQQLNVYALAAGAAGVGVLALAQPANAEIIYTPIHRSILGPKGFFGLDLNHDGTIDFGITNTTYFNTDQAFSNLFVKAQAGNLVAGTFVYFGFPPNARAFKSGSQIGPSERFFKDSAKLVSYYVGGGGSSAHGNWIDVGNRYLGLAFQIDGHTHFGWARLSVHIENQGLRIKAVLNGFAYETEPDTPIIAGATSGTYEGAEGADAAPARETPKRPTLGMLASGAVALQKWRE